MTPSLALRQASLPEFCPVTAAVQALANASATEERGAVFTKPAVVGFILDLCGYTIDQPLHLRRLLEPSFGNGDFLLPAIDRLLANWRIKGAQAEPLQELKDCIRAVELHRDTFIRTHAAVIARLVGEGIAKSTAIALADHWLIFGDFLLIDIHGGFDFVVGNPPYVRQELIPGVLMAEYRARYSTIYDRADLYVPFIERSLRLLATGGVLGFICADRWMKNRYGTRLRSLVAGNYHLRAYIDMTGTSAFRADVTAYPAVTVIAREANAPTRVAHRPTLEVDRLTELANLINAPCLPTSTRAVREIFAVTSGEEPWLLDGSDHVHLLRRLERDFPPLEDVGCKVGIGVATGADRVFIGPFAELDVEADRKLPLVMTRDILSGRIAWRGYGVVNPFNDGPGSGLVELDKFPRMKRYLEAHKDVIAARHVALKSPACWYRTIDRITPALAGKPKLLIPDIKGQAQIVFDDGRFYPHHNLYFVTSDEWELRALQAVLLSSVAGLFVASYSTKMRGGFLRFQAQYLRRIRLPRWADVTASLRNDLKRAAESLDLVACDAAAFSLYKLTSGEQTALLRIGE